MSKHNYNAQYNKNNRVNTAPVEEVANEVTVEEVVEETTEQTVEAPVEEIVVEEPKKTKASTQYGIVVNCSKLNIRKEPNKSATILCEVRAGAKLQIKDNNAASEWYRIVTDGVAGFCMKKFVEVK